MGVLAWTTFNDDGLLDYIKADLDKRNHCHIEIRYDCENAAKGERPFSVLLSFLPTAGVQCEPELGSHETVKAAKDACERFVKAVASPAVKAALLKAEKCRG